MTTTVSPDDFGRRPDGKITVEDMRAALDGESGRRAIRKLSEYLDKRSGDPVDAPTTIMTSKEYQLCAGALRYMEANLRAEIAARERKPT